MALAGVVPALPLTFDDAAALFALMRGIARPPLILEVTIDPPLHPAGIVARVFDGKREIYQRTLYAR